MQHTIIVNGKKTMKTVGHLNLELQRWSVVDKCEWISGEVRIRLGHGFKMENLNMTINIIIQFLDVKKDQISFDAQNNIAVFCVQKG